MFKLKIVGNADLKHKSFDKLQLKTFKASQEAKHSFHSTGQLNAKLISRHNKSISNIKKVEIDKVIQVANDTTKQISKKSLEEKFKRAESHYTVHDVLSEDKDTVTIIFLPITTSHKKISYGLQKFDTLYMHSNGLKNFYTTRILYQKTMTKDFYNE